MEKKIKAQRSIASLGRGSQLRFVSIGIYIYFIT